MAMTRNFPHRPLTTAVFLLGAIVSFPLLASHPAQARDTKLHPQIAAVLSDPDFKQKLGGDIAFYFANQPAPVGKTLGEYVTNRKTNSFGRPDEEACRWAMLSALIELRDRAKSLGGNAVINIVSYYKKNTYASPTDYECHAGDFVAGVALKGTVAVVGSGGSVSAR